MTADKAARRLVEMADNQRLVIAAKCKTEGLDQLRYEAGVLDGLKAAIGILLQEQEDDGEQ